MVEVDCGVVVRPTVVFVRPAPRPRRKLLRYERRDRFS